MHVRHTVLAPLALLSLALCACREQSVASYRVPKETPPPAPAAPAAMPGMPAAPGAPAADANATMANTAVTTAQGAGLAWTAPAHWTAKTVSAMRRGAYAIKGADGSEAELAITAFPGDVGGNLANVNRWRNQLQLPPIAQSELEAALTHLDYNGLHMDVVDLVGPAGAKTQRTLGAIVPFEGATWFFKLSGPDAVVAAEKPAFLAFLQTIRAP